MTRNSERSKISSRQPKRGTSLYDSFERGLLRGQARGACVLTCLRIILERSSQVCLNSKPVCGAKHYLTGGPRLRPAVMVSRSRFFWPEVHLLNRMMVLRAGVAGAIKSPYPGTPNQAPQGTSGNLRGPRIISILGS